MKKIYIVLTYTGTIPSKIIKLYTKKMYSHVSISLDEKLNEMYSFARLNPYNAFYAGFLQESIDSGTFKRFKNTRCLIYWLEVTDKQYDIIKNTIEYIKENRKKYKFNMLGLFLVSLHRRRIKKYFFYCAEFVRYLLQKANMGKNLPNIIKPEDFKNLDGIKFLYEGKLTEYGKRKIMLEK
ncbi:MAG: hypothetical protein HFJ54_00150 [Clostridia bacterium]|nr:hypothetical protein [Clostridia bacterium]